MKKIGRKMKTIYSRLKIIPVCLALMALCGCVNYEEETYLNDDMSGRLTISLSINAQDAMKAVMAKIEAQRQSQPAGTKPLMSDLAKQAKVSMGTEVSDKDFMDAFNVSAIKKKSYKKSETGDITTVSLDVEFDDIRKLFEGKKNVTVTTNKDGSITYTEYFEPIKDRETKDARENEELFRKSRFKYVLHMPRDIISANTAKIEKNTAEWDLPLAAAYKKDFYITATMKSENRLFRLLRYFKRK
jgi:hypothetical protein